MFYLGMSHPRMDEEILFSYLISSRKSNQNIFFFHQKIFVFLIFLYFMSVLGTKYAPKSRILAHFFPNLLPCFMDGFTVSQHLGKKTGQEVAPCYHRNKDMPGGGGRNQSSFGLFKMIGFPKRESVKPSNKPTKMASNGKITPFFLEKIGDTDSHSWLGFSNCHVSLGPWLVDMFFPSRPNPKRKVPKSL